MRPLYLFSSTFSYRNAWHGIRAKCGEKKQKCRLYLHKSYTLRPYPTPYPSPEIVSKYKESDTMV